LEGKEEGKAFVLSEKRFVSAPREKKKGRFFSEKTDAQEETPTMSRKLHPAEIMTKKMEVTEIFWRVTGSTNHRTKGKVMRRGGREAGGGKRSRPRRDFRLVRWERRSYDGGEGRGGGLKSVG